MYCRKKEPRKVFQPRRLGSRGDPRSHNISVLYYLSLLCLKPSDLGKQRVAEQQTAQSPLSPYTIGLRVQGQAISVRLVQERPLLSIFPQPFLEVIIP